MVVVFIENCEVIGMHGTVEQFKKGQLGVARHRSSVNDGLWLVDIEVPSGDWRYMAALAPHPSSNWSSLRHERVGPYFVWADREFLAPALTVAGRILAQ